MDARLHEIFDRLNDSFERIVDDLRNFIKIPSISGNDNHQDDINLAVQWLHDRLSKLSLDRLVVFETIGNPIVYAECKSGKNNAPTVLIYGHYDVQPAISIEDWKTEPFEAEIMGDYLYGRGASDMKGQILAYIGTLEAILSSGSFPVNIKLLLEGDEETDPEPLAKFIKDNRELLECDFSLNCDALLIGINEPTIVYGLRGGIEYTVKIFGPSTDIHGGLYGGVIENPIHVLSKLIAGITDESGRVTLPNFYERVRQMDTEERAELARLPLDESYFLKISGAPSLCGEVDFLPVERAGARPALNVRMFEGGGEKGAIPSEAKAGLTFRLVPDQDPDEAHEQFVTYVKNNVPPTVTWEIADYVGWSPSLVKRDSQGVKAMSQALEKVWGVNPLFLLDGGSIPVVGLLQEIMGVESVLIGLSLPDDNIHGPNERIHLPTLKRGIAALIHFFFILADEAEWENDGT
jgi:acetylornithine deacetylase/succinyl-diaminopimelate desuccinylase-like protein